MHSHDIEIIMALTEGSLDPVAAEAARADIAACQECSSDVAMQAAALSALQAMPAASLTEFESAQLRRNVRAELGLSKATEFQPSPRRRRMPLAALGTAAAVLLAIVVAAPALNLIRGSDDTSDATVAAASASTTVAAFQLDSAAPSGGDNESIAGVSENAPGSTERASTTAPSSPATTRDLTADPSLYAYFQSEQNLALLLNTVATNGFDEDTSRSEVLKAAPESILEEDPGDSQACANVTITSSANFVEGFQLARGRLAGRDVIFIVYLAEDLQESELILHDAATCEELGRAGL